MLFLKGHGKQAQPNSMDAEQYKNGQQTMAAVCGFDKSEYYPDPMEAPFGEFGYFFPDSPETSNNANTTKLLDALGDAMVDSQPPEEDNSGLPAIFTYIGQFIDHDITAGTDREQDISIIDTERVSPLPRTEVIAKVANLRTGSLDLDSLYGGAALQGTFAAKMTEALRWPKDRAKLRIGVDKKLPGKQRPPLPKDIAGDVLRFGALIKGKNPIITNQDLKNLPIDLAKLFLDEEGNPRKSKAVIGDSRNDENLAVAQFHLSMARLHNKFVDAVRSKDVRNHENDREAVFQWARQQVQFHYQWLILNEYLPGICDASVLKDVIKNEAPLYGEFLNRWGGIRDNRMPMPLEFSVSAFRFGHTMARPSYDWNRFFGRPAKGFTGILERADFNLMFAFTGNEKNPMAGRGPNLPSNWVAEMERFLNIGQKFADRNTRMIDTNIAPDLHAMVNEPKGLHEILRRLPRRNLRRGVRLNIPSAQACLKTLSNSGIVLPQLTKKQLLSGSTSHAVSSGNFQNETPLWFYILKEAEIFGKGQNLGPLGSRIVAETLVGLVVHGKNTFWREMTKTKRWHPKDAVTVRRGVVVDSFENLMKAALFL